MRTLTACYVCRRRTAKTSTTDGTHTITECVACGTVHSIQRSTR